MLTASRAHELFFFDVLNGVLLRRQSRGGERAGSVAGSPHCDGYLAVCVDGRRYLVHRVIWLMWHGSWSPADLDHWDTDRSNNRLHNLRAATRTQNNANSSVRTNCKARLKGVQRAHNSYKYQARIRCDGRQIYLGLFNTAEEAHAAYMIAAQQHFGQFARA